MGRLIDADILIAELKESASHHCNNPREDSLLQRDRVIVRAQPTVDAISKVDYEARLKADTVAMLTDIQLEIEEKAIHKQGIDSGFEYDYEFISSEEVIELIQQKIDALKEVVEDGKID